MRVTESSLITIAWDDLADLRATATGRAFRANPDQLALHEGYATDVMGQALKGGTFYVGAYKIAPASWYELTSHPDLPSFTSRYRSFAAGDWLGLCESRRRVRRFTEDDGEFCEDRRGNDRPFESNAYQLTATSHRGQVDLICQFGGNEDLTAWQLENAGLAACALADKLESEGYRVRVLAADCAYDYERTARTLRTVVLKRHDEPLDIGRLGLVLGCGPFYRTVFFQACIKTARRISSGLGRATYFTLADCAHLGLSETAMIVPTMLTESDAKAFVHRVAGEVVTA